MRKQELEARKEELAKLFAETCSIDKLTFESIEEIYKTGFDAAVNLLNIVQTDDDNYCGAV